MPNVVPPAQAMGRSPKLVRRAVLLAGVLAGLQAADPVVASLALPKAGKSLDMGASALAMAASISTLFLAATVVLTGALADRIGRRRMVLILTVGLIAADLLVSVAPQTAIFMLGRAIAGVCAGGLVAAAYAYVRTVSPPNRLGANLGLFAAITFGLSVPITIGAAGLASINWRLAFLCIPAIAAICLLFEVKVFPWIPPHPIKKQLYGVSIAGLGVVGILYGVSKTSVRLFSVFTEVPIVIGLILVAIAGIIGIKSSRPAYPVPIFRSPVFIAAAISGVLWNLALAVAQLQSSNLWQYAYALEPFTVAIWQLPFTLAIMVGSLLIGRWLTRGLRPRETITLGFLVAAVGFVIMSLTGTSPVGILFNLALVVVGFGAGAAAVAQSQILLDEAPNEFVGSVTASRTTFGQIGYALGLAGGSAVTVLMTIRMLGTPDAREQLNVFLTTDRQAIADNPALGQITSHVAPVYASGVKAGMLWCGVLLVVGALVCFLLMTMRTRISRTYEPPQDGPIDVKWC